MMEQIEPRLQFLIYRRLSCGSGSVAKCVFENEVCDWTLL
jgi:hypothetical protein